MIRIERLSAAEVDLERFARVAEGLYAPPLSEEAPLAESQCLLADREGEWVARCAASVTHDLEGAPGTSGLVHHFEARDGEAAIRILTEARDLLAGARVIRVLGPLHGSTWKRYRLALPPEPGDPIVDPEPFPGEPRNPVEYPGYFAAAGFEAVAHYESRLDEDLAAVAPDADAIRRGIEARGWTVRMLDAARYEREMTALFELSRQAFSRNLYYSPIDLESFRALYEPIRALLDPDLIFLVEDAAGKPISFLFGYPDPWTASAGRATRFVAKTLATAPSARGQGLARHLFDRLRQAAGAKGYRQIVHALLHVDNRSRDVSLRHESRLFRRYALYQWTP